MRPWGNWSSRQEGTILCSLTCLQENPPRSLRTADQRLQQLSSPALSGQHWHLLCSGIGLACCNREAYDCIGSETPIPQGDWVMSEERYRCSSRMLHSQTLRVSILPCWRKGGAVCICPKGFISKMIRSDVAAYVYL